MILIDKKAGEEWEFQGYDSQVPKGSYYLTGGGYMIQVEYDVKLTTPVAVFRAVPKRHRFPKEGFPAVVFEETGEYRRARRGEYYTVSGRMYWWECKDETGLSFTILRPVEVLNA